MSLSIFNLHILLPSYSAWVFNQFLSLAATKSCQKWEVALKNFVKSLVAVTLWHIALSNKLSKCLSTCTGSIFRRNFHSLNQTGLLTDLTSRLAQRQHCCPGFNAWLVGSSGAPGIFEGFPGGGRWISLGWYIQTTRPQLTFRTFDFFRAINTQNYTDQRNEHLNIDQHDKSYLNERNNFGVVGWGLWTILQTATRGWHAVVFSGQFIL